jgi:hypothetical protein
MEKILIYWPINVSIRNIDNSPDQIHRKSVYRLIIYKSIYTDISTDRDISTYRLINNRDISTETSINLNRYISIEPYRCRSIDWQRSRDMDISIHIYMDRNISIYQ